MRMNETINTMPEYERLRADYEKRLQEVEQNYQKQLIQMADEAKRANMAKTDFLRRMSHDMRTPINAINGYVRIAGAFPDDQVKQQECRNKILTASGYLLEMIKSVLDMSKLEAGMFEIEEDAFDMSELMDEVAALVDAQLVEAGITHHRLRKNIQHTALRGSSLQLRRIMLNLLSNAIKYNKPNGSIDTYAEELSCDGTTVWYEFKIVDTGIGMSEEFVRDHLFQPFTQEKNDARTLYKGTGLGMSIVKALLEKMGGCIDVESVHGEGSTFTFRLPFKVNDVLIQKEERNESSEKPLAGMHFLLAEDNEINMEIAEFYLTDLGATVSKAWNGKEALELFEASEPESYDVILMDVMMPEMDGHEAAQRIRALKRPDTQTVRIVAMTAQTSEDSIHKCLDAGMDGHIAKPINEEKILSALHKNIETE